MEIRKSTTEDIKLIMAIFTTAREYMIAHGNKTQWGEGYPDEKILKTDINAGNNYVIINNGIVVGTFSFIIGEEPTYQINNITMQTAIEKFGFHKCGNIYVRGGAERIAYDYLSRNRHKLT